MLYYSNVAGFFISSAMLALFAVPILGFPEALPKPVEDEIKPGNESNDDDEDETVHMAFNDVSLKSKFLVHMAVSWV